jgi:hypothetical protein
LRVLYCCCQEKRKAAVNALKGPLPVEEEEEGDHFVDDEMDFTSPPKFVLILK